MFCTLNSLTFNSTHFIHLTHFMYKICFNFFADQAILSPCIVTAFLCQRCILYTAYLNLITKSTQNNKTYLLLTKISTGAWDGSGIERSHVLQIRYKQLLRVYIHPIYMKFSCFCFKNGNFIPQHFIVLLKSSNIYIIMCGVIKNDHHHYP